MKVLYSYDKTNIYAIKAVLSSKILIAKKHTIEDKDIYNISHNIDL